MNHKFCILKSIFFILVLGCIFCLNVTSYAEGTSGVTYIYNESNLTKPTGINLNGNSVIFQESDVEGEFNMYLDLDQDGIIDDDESMVSLAKAGEEAKTSFAPDYAIYGFYQGTSKSPIVITINSGSLPAIYGISNATTESSVVIKMNGGSVSAIYGASDAVVGDGVSIIMNDGEINNIFGACKSMISSKSNDAISIQVLDGVVKYDMTGSDSSYVVAGNGYKALNMHVTDDAILRYGLYAVKGQKQSGVEGDIYGIVGDVVVSTIASLEEEMTTDTNIYVVDGASVNGNLMFTHLGGDIGNLLLVKGTVNGSVVANMEACETSSVVLFDHATIEGDITVNQKATVNTYKYVVADTCDMKGNVTANIYGGLKDDVFSFHYHLFDETEVAGNLKVLVSGGNIDCLNLFNDGSVGGFADVDIIDVDNPDAGFVGSGCFANSTIGKDLSVDVINSEFTGFMIMNNAICNGDANINVKDSLFRNYIYASYGSTTVVGNLDATFNDLTVEEYFYTFYDGDFQKAATITINKCESPEIVAISGGTRVIGDELTLNINDCVADKINACNATLVKPATINMKGGVYGANQEATVYSTILSNSSNTALVHVNLNDVSFGEHSYVSVTGGDNTILNIQNCDMGETLYVTANFDKSKSNIVTLKDSTVNNLSVSNATLFVPKDEPLSVKGEFVRGQQLYLVLQDDFNVTKESDGYNAKVTSFLCGGISNVVGIDETFYGIDASKLKDKATVSCKDATTFSYLDDIYFKKAQETIALKIKAADGLELVSVSAKANETEISDITVKDDLYTFTMPEAFVVLDAVTKKQHSFDKKWSNDATSHWHGCVDKECKEIKDKAAHNWDDGVVEKEATETATGSKKYTCTVCGYIKTETIPMLITGTLAVGTDLVDSKTKATYTVTKAGAEVSYANPKNKKVKTVTIPDTIELNGCVYKVTSIDKKAFYNCKKLKKVTIGKNVKVIGAQAFYKCTALKSITIPSKVSSIGKKAFYGCKALKTITFKTKKLTTKNVGDKAFKGTHSKATVKVPKKKYNSYVKMLKKKGIHKKAKFLKR